MLKIDKNISQIVFNNHVINFIKFNNIKYYEKDDKPIYSFGLLSDTHVDGDTADTYLTIPKFDNALNFYKNNVDFVNICGDVGFDGREEDYIAYKKVVDKYTIDINTISGNHDAKNMALYTKYTGDSLYYEKIYHNDVFLFLGTKEGYTTDSIMTSEELTWFKNKLEEYKNKRVFVLFHFFMAPPGNANKLARTGVFNPNSAQYIEVENLLKHYTNIIFITGHSHLEFAMQKYDVNANYYHSNSMCNRIHVPSLGYPKTNDTGSSNTNTYNLKDVGFGYVVNVYKDEVIFKAIKFTTHSYEYLNNYVYKIKNI